MAQQRNTPIHEDIKNPELKMIVTGSDSVIEQITLQASSLQDVGHYTTGEASLAAAKQRCSTCSTLREEDCFEHGKATCTRCLQKKRKSNARQIEGIRQCSTCRRQQTVENFTGAQATCKKCLDRRKIKRQKHSNTLSDDAVDPQFGIAGVDFGSTCSTGAEMKSSSVMQISALVAPLQGRETLRMNSGSAQRDDIFEMIVGKGETGPAEDSEQAPFISVPGNH